VAQALAHHPACTVEVPGGILRARDNALEGEQTEQWLRGVEADIVIISAVGIDPQGQIYDRDERELPVLHAMLDQAREHWLLADTGKFQRQTPTVSGHLRQMKRVFTEGLPPAPLPALMQELGVSLTIAS
jgi:DeoR family glycerol-3-phosphate regulon repressor